MRCKHLPVSSVQPEGFDWVVELRTVGGSQESTSRQDFLGRMVEGVAAWFGPDPPPPPQVEARLNPLFFSQLEADIHYQA